MPRRLLACLVLLCCAGTTAGCRGYSAWLKEVVAAKPHLADRHDTPHRVAILNTGRDAFLWRIERIRGARKTIKIQTFILGFSVFPIAMKWLFIGKWRQETFPIWSLRYFRFWAIKALVSSAPMAVFPGGPVYNLYLRLDASSRENGASRDTVNSDKKAPHRRAINIAFLVQNWCDVVRPGCGLALAFQEEKTLPCVHHHRFLDTAPTYRRTLPLPPRRTRLVQPQHFLQAAPFLLHVSDSSPCFRVDS